MTPVELAAMGRAGRVRAARGAATDDGGGARGGDDPDAARRHEEVSSRGDARSIGLSHNEFSACANLTRAGSDGLPL